MSAKGSAWPSSATETLLLLGQSPELFQRVQV